MSSPHGRRGAICQHFGWTYDYLLNGIAWGLVQRMMIAAPSYDKGEEDENIVLTEDNAQNIMNYVNSFI